MFPTTPSNWPYTPLSSPHRHKVILNPRYSRHLPQTPRLSSAPLSPTTHNSPATARLPFCNPSLGTTPRPSSPRYAGTHVSTQGRKNRLDCNRLMARNRYLLAAGYAVDGQSRSRKWKGGDSHTRCRSTDSRSLWPCPGSSSIRTCAGHGSSRRADVRTQSSSSEI